MPFRPLRLMTGILVGLFGCTLFVTAEPPDVGIETLPNRTFVHKESKTNLKVPAGWTILPPYRLRKTTTSSVLGIEKENPRIAMTIVWSHMNNRPWTDVIRATEGDDLGEEYSILTTVYGKAKVSRPTTYKVGPITVFKVLVDDGPDKVYAGALYLFEAGTGDQRWKVKIRANFPQMGREEYIKQVEEVVAQFTLMQGT